MNIFEVIELAREHERMVAAATKVIGDWRASQKVQGMVIHSTECRDDCRRCRPEPKAPQWASLTALDELLQVQK